MYRKLIGTVTSVKPFRIKFDIDDKVSDRTYPCLESYSPTNGDRVAVLQLDNSYLVLGKEVYYD